MEEKIGIWLDLRSAFIVFLKEEKGKISTRFKLIESDIPSKRAKGGARSSVPWGPMHKVAEDKLLDKRNFRIKEYMEEIKSEIKKGKELYIFGPASAKEELKKSIYNDPNCKINILKIETADQMTENQKVARVREFFLAINA